MLGEYLAADTGWFITRSRERITLANYGWNWGLPLLWAVDFNVDPMCSVVAQRQGDQINVLDEIVISRAST